MPSPGFLTKTFIAGFFFGHLFIPAEKSWLFKLARSPAFGFPLQPTLSKLNVTGTRNGSQRAQSVDSQRYRYLVNDNPPVLVHPSPGNLSVSSTRAPDLHLTPTHSATHHRPTLSPGSSTRVLPNSSDPTTYHPSATQSTISTTLYCSYGLPSASARPPILAVIPSRRVAGPGPSTQFGLTFRSLLCISILLYYVIPAVSRKRAPRHKTRKLPGRAVSTIISNLQGDPQSLKACSLVSRSWTKESRRHLFHTISLNSRKSADLWFSPDTLSLAIHVHSIHLSMETIAGTERELSRFLCVKMLRISDWCGSKHSLPTVWSPLDRTVEHLELVQPEGTPHEILTFVSPFTSLESFCIACSHQQSKCEVQSTYTVDPATVSI